jgi:methyltransferase (TIGR00027 family)
MGSAAPLEGVAATALVIAAIRAEETARPDRLFADPLAASFVAASDWSPSRPPGDRRATALQAWAVARTVFLDDLLASACQDGCRQVVLLGAGLDARAFRLPWPSGVRCFELDTADVLDSKAEVLTAERASAGCERVTVACDLRADWPGALLAAGFDHGQPAVWVAEGVLVYLAQEDVDRVLADLTTLSAPGSRLGLPMASGDPAGVGQRSRMGMLRRSAAPDDPVGWLAGHGWTAQVTDARSELEARGRLLPPRHAEHGQPPERRPRGLLISAARDASARPSRRGEPGRPPDRRRRGLLISAARDASARLPRPAGEPIPPLSLSALLSHALVAFTIECDNEFERQMPHSTTNHGRTPGAPWLVSLAMWCNCLRFVGTEPITVAELEQRARTGTNLDGMRRWGYIDVRPDPDDRRSKPPRSGLTVRATPAGLRAQQVWRPLPGVVERGWEERFGRDAIGDLRESLRSVAGRLGAGLPDCLPILGHGLWTRGPDHASPPADVSGLGLPALLSRVLLTFAMDFEHVSDVSLAVSANGLRILDQQAVRVREMPVLAGVSKEGISMAITILRERHLAVVEPDPDGGRWKVARLTPKGRNARETCQRLLGVTEERWQARFGSAAVRALRESLDRLAGDPAAPSPLLRGMEPYPDGWRATVRRPQTLPYYPLVLHRGGFPDGS